jgi:hypothetical protein
MHTNNSRYVPAISAAALAALFTALVTPISPSAQAADGPLVRSATGTAAADIAPSVNEFRADLGGGSTAAPNGSFGGVRREINWDGVPDQFSAPNDFPADFFNTRSPRGAVFSTPGLNFQVSANAASGTRVRFGNLNPVYVKDFGVFSPERLFSPIISTTTDVHFFVAGTKTPALVKGFGAVFSDVDSPTSTSLQFYDRADVLIATIAVPATPGDATHSFAGATLPGDPQIARVRVISGGQVLSNGTDDSAQASRDKVAMDDFIFSEPVAVPVVASTVPTPPTTAAVLASPTTAAVPTTKAKAKAAKKSTKKKVVKTKVAKTTK